MKRIAWLGWFVAPLLLVVARPAWALRCGSQLVRQGDLAAQVIQRCGQPFFVDHYATLLPNGGVTPVEPAVTVTYEAWYYNFGPQRLMIRLLFSNGELMREQTLGYGFSGNGGPCDFTTITSGMSVAELIAHCGFPMQRGRNILTYGGYGDPRSAPAWGETWFYPAEGSRHAREVRLQDGRVTDVQVVN